MQALKEVGYADNLNLECNAPEPDPLKKADYTCLAAIDRYLAAL